MALHTDIPRPALPGPAPAFSDLLARPDAEAPMRVAILVRDGIDRLQAEQVVQRLEESGHLTEVLGPHLGSVLCRDGSRLAVDASLRRWSLRHFDHVVVLGAGTADRTLTTDEAAFLRPRSGEAPVPVDFVGRCEPVAVPVRAAAGFSSVA